MDPVVYPQQVRMLLFFKHIHNFHLPLSFIGLIESLDKTKIFSFTACILSTPERIDLRRDGVTVYSYNTYFQHISSSIVED